MTWKRLIPLFALLAFSCAKEKNTPLPVAEPAFHTISAGFAEADPATRSRLDFTETEAHVLWTKGDSFKMVRMNETNYSARTYTTMEDGVETAVFGCQGNPMDGTEFTSGYPADVYRVGRRGEMGCYLITPVPSEQQAVPGGIEEGLGRAAAYSTSSSDNLHFYNMLSIIRFRLDGDIVPSVVSVTFDAGKNVAGDATVYFVDGEPVIDFSKNWKNPTVERSNSVTLSGPFEAGRDYCLVLVPVSMPSGFDMVFRDDEGHSIIKHSSKALTLSRSRITDFGTIHLGDSWVEDKPETIEYLHQTKGSKKNVICFLAEGFREEELDQFEVLAKNAADYLFSVEPYKSYKEYFTVYLHRVASNESGASVTDGNGNIVTAVDSYFSSRWGESSYGDMKADAAKIQSYIKTHVPEIISGELSYKNVPVTLLINDTRYGGICHIYSNGWNYALVPYQYGGRSIKWSFPKYQAVNPMDDSEGYRETTDEERDEMGRNVGDWRNTFLHEFGGHAYPRLTDEYWSAKTKYTEPGAVGGHSYTVPYALNASGFYDNVPWQVDLLDDLDEWVARNPDYGRIGIWHGGMASLYYRWRSEKTSCMIDNRPYFSTWQRILIVRKIMDKAGETFDMQSFIDKDVTTDPVRPAPNASPSALAQARARAALVPEVPMLPPPVFHKEDE